MSKIKFITKSSSKDQTPLKTLQLVTQYLPSVLESPLKKLEGA